MKNKGRNTKIFLFSAVVTFAAAFPAYAGAWQYDEAGQWYQNDDGSYPWQEWKWIDDDQDGTAECYYFDENGYLLKNTETPDHHIVDENGAWYAGGRVQTKNAGASGGPAGDEDGYLWDYVWGWYDQDESLSEGDRAFYHFYDNYYAMDYGGREESERVMEQYNRIAENPCSETAQQEMAWVEIPIWRLKGGQKVAGTTRVQVLSSLVDEVREIFTEIYQGPEQFPINSVSAYAWRNNGLGSLHSAGLAIDINPDQNPQVSEDGTVLVGGKWEPGVNPYSIWRDSDVLKAFGRHGWYWGAGFTTKDYMHFEW